MIYITKEITVRDVEVDIELEECDVLEQMDTDTVIEYVVDRVDASRILDRLSGRDIIEYLTKNKTLFASLLRQIADGLNS